LIGRFFSLFHFFFLKNEGMGGVCKANKRKAGELLLWGVWFIKPKILSKLKSLSYDTQ
jgi:hypothetical protein